MARRSATLDALAPRLAPALIRLYLGTIRVRWLGIEPCDPPVDLRTPFVYAFWHQRLLLFTYTHRSRGITILVSQHADGELIARTAEGLGFRSVRGSSTRGGERALRELTHARGIDIAVTPDGPRGPRHRLKAGIIYLAAATGYPIMPATVSYERFWQVGSWDGFLLPRPFTRGLVRAAAPYRVPATATGDPEPHRRAVERILRDLTFDTDRRFGQLWREARVGPPQFLRTRATSST